MLLTNSLQVQKFQSESAEKHGMHLKTRKEIQICRHHNFSNTNSLQVIDFKI